MKNNSGQAAIVICFSFITLFLLLALTINVGIYINDKINLQNAADAGAYVGASEQARLMQEIGYANYELRQLYKNFIYRYRYQFSIDNDRDPVISPSVCVTFPFCDCIVPKSTNPPFDGPSGMGKFNPGLPACGSEADRTEEMIVSSHGSGNFIHQMPWNAESAYDCDYHTEQNRKQAYELKILFEDAFRGKINEKLPHLMQLINQKNGRAEKIARATIKANLTAGNKGVKIEFPKPNEVASASGLPSGPNLSLIQQNSTFTYRIYYTVWSPKIADGTYYNNTTPLIKYYTCLRHHAGGYVEMNLDGLWFLKNPELTTAFVTLLEREEDEFPFAFKFFGKAPKMTAVSAAKPFGSSIGWPDPYSTETIVPELYVRDDHPPFPNQFKASKGNPAAINPSYLDFMEAFYWFDNSEYQSVTGDFMPIPLMAKNEVLDKLHFTFDSEAFPGLNIDHDRVRFEKSWPYDPAGGIRGRSGYSVKFIALRDLSGQEDSRYRNKGINIPEINLINH